MNDPRFCSEELQEIPTAAIKTAMLALDEGIHDIWVAEDMVTLGEAYTYLFNQEKLKSIESAKILVSLLFVEDLTRSKAASYLNDAQGSQRN